MKSYYENKMNAITFVKIKIDKLKPGEMIYRDILLSDLGANFGIGKKTLDIVINPLLNAVVLEAKDISGRTYYKKMA